MLSHTHETIHDFHKGGLVPASPNATKIRGYAGQERRVSEYGKTLGRGIQLGGGPLPPWCLKVTFAPASHHLSFPCPMAWFALPSQGDGTRGKCRALKPMGQHQDPPAWKKRQAGVETERLSIKREINREKGNKEKKRKEQNPYNPYARNNMIK